MLKIKFTLLIKKSEYLKYPRSIKFAVIPSIRINFLEILLRSNSHIPLLKAASLCKSELSDIDIDPVNFS